MPPWSSRLLSGGSSSNAAPARGQPSNPRDKALPRPPPEYLDPPTLNPERNAPSPSRTRASGARQHAHSRSVSNPLPKFFGRKKSNGNLNFNDTDVPLDDELVPVLDGTPDERPVRVISGKKGKLDEDDKTARHCMCCDSRVKVPRELQKFRCMCCLTINDLKPMEEQTESDKERPQVKRSGTYPGQLPPGARLPISLDHTSSLIDRCLAKYLEARCRRQEEPVALPQKPTPKEDIFAPPARAHDLPVATPEEECYAGQRLGHPPISGSPPDTPQEAEWASATIRDIAELNKFGGMRMDTPPPEQSLTAQEEFGPSSATSRQAAPIPIKPTRKPPPPPMAFTNRRPSQKLLPVGSLTPTGAHSPRPAMSPRLTAEEMEQRRHADRIKSIFRPLEEYMIENFGNYQCLNKSFSTLRPMASGRAQSESNVVSPPAEPAGDSRQSAMDGLSELDAKTLLLGDIGENGTWWTGKVDRKQSDKAVRRKGVGEGSKKAVSSKSPNIDWSELGRWYRLVHTAGSNWRAKVAQIGQDDPSMEKSSLDGDINVEEIEDDLVAAREHAIRTLLKITENLLKRPTRPVKEPEDIRFLLILLSNPSLYPSSQPRRATSGTGRVSSRTQSDRRNGKLQASPVPPSPKKSPGQQGGQHNGLLKRIFGLIAHSAENCHRYLINWFARFEEEHFVKTVDLVASFVTHRIGRRPGRHRSRSGLDDGGLIPTLSGSAMSTSAQLHSAMGLSGSVKKSGEDPNSEPQWAGDWQVKAAARVMSLLFTANNIWSGASRPLGASRVDSLLSGTSISPQARARRSGQLLHTSSFYNTLLDYHDMIADFKVWEARRDKFAFCQYPLFLSMGTKIKILEYDARRQMESKAREAYFDQVIRQRAIDGNFHLRVRRECMVDDSLRQISEAVGSGQEELKKGLRVHFTGEEGVDAGGPRKEWFLMLVRDIFDPNHGMFVYDDESNTCYFNANSFETSDQYYLVGALLGLAIYNSTILDVAFPPFAFRKLLAAAPSSITNASNVSSLTGTKGQMTYTVSDLAEFRPSLAAGLQQLLEFEGDVESTYCRDFVAPVERYGTVQNVPLIPNGENTPVTNANRHEFVDAYVRYLLDTAVSRQFEPFKRGFFTVCAGNALSLFRAEEIELLIRGSDEALDVDSLRAVAVYENWKHFQPPHAQIANPSESVPVIGWFWELFAEASPERQRKLLTFITGTDRIPAVGATSLVLRIVAGGDGWGGGGKEERERFPVARTCFNMLVLWRYDYREQLEEKLWRAVEESEGFGLK
ncbi:E3 ubiquitin- ligase HUL4 [Lecanosticta acicola]|uniref:HECT-type E3 ubiquitin transferase n=1 Tax=Lecanosticta acicola TaxID=111012 RepID=A0AAI8Z5Z4_9PEZI|nr:E3 ubiquitin- ligase HUL4 [Lecanosticta acicola]